MSRQGLRKLEELKAAGRDPRAAENATYKRRMAFRNSALTLAEKDDGLTDEDLWAERGAYWEGQADPQDRPFSPWDRGREDKPLILSGHGVRLRIRHGALEVRHGFTHYPQRPRTDILWPGDRRMPPRIVLIDPDGIVTFDVVAFLSRQRIPLVVLDWRGRVVSTLGGKPGPLDLGLRRAQLAALTNGTGLQIATDLIRRKLVGSIETLRSLPTSSKVVAGIDRLGQVLDELDAGPRRDTQSLLIPEANGASAYFRAWLDLPLRWKGTARRPVPAEWYRMPLRSSFFGDRNRHASHPVMAALNLAYAVLESQVRSAATAAGLDVTIGYLHASNPGRHALVFDLMEPLRPRTDRLVLDLVRSHAFSSGDVFLTEGGVCRLHPQMARAVAGLAIHDQTIQRTIEEVRSMLLRSGA